MWGDGTHDGVETEPERERESYAGAAKLPDGTNITHCIRNVRASNALHTSTRLTTMAYGYVEDSDCECKIIKKTNRNSSHNCCPPHTIRPYATPNQCRCYYAVTDWVRLLRFLLNVFVHPFSLHALPEASPIKISSNHNDQSTCIDRGNHPSPIILRVTQNYKQ